MLEVPLLPERALLFHHRDEALDHPWGEGSEEWLYRVDGALWLRTYTFHVDFDGHTSTRRVEEEEAVALALRLGLEHRLGECFPDSLEGRLVARFGTCNRRDLERHADAIAAQPVVCARGEERVVGEVGGPYALIEPDPDTLRLRLLHPGPARAALRRLGATAEAFRTHFPDSAERVLLDAAGLPDWAAVAAAADGALPDAREVFAGSSWRLLRAPRLGDVRVGDPADPVAPLAPHEALRALLSADAPRAVVEALFPEPEPWWRVQRDVGISFPAADESD